MWNVQYQMEMRKLDVVHVPQITQNLVRGPQTNVQSLLFITHVYSYCFAHSTLFGDVLVAVVVVVCLR